MHQDADPTSTAAPAIPPLPLDAYPRLCGLPVTIERLAPTTSVAAPTEQPAETRPARAKRPVARTAVVVLVVAATVLAVVSEARAQAPLPDVQVCAA
jgi:hypothetical protein